MWINLPHFLSDGSQKYCWIQGRPSHVGPPAISLNAIGDEGLGKGFPSGVVKVPSLVVPYDPNDVEISVVRRIQKGTVENVHLDLSAERVVGRKIIAS